MSPRHDDDLPTEHAGALIRAAVAEDAAPLVGAPLKYHLQGAIGRGGMGAEVLRAESESGNAVAIKILPAQFARDPEILRRFEREIRSMRSVLHSNLVEILDFGTTGEGSPFIVMELVEDGSLADRLAKKRNLSTVEAIRLAVAVCGALEVVHSKGLVHRDIKPSNILLRQDGSPKLADFGLAKFLSSVSSPLTHTGDVIGTFGYMAPEQVGGKTTVDHRADIYSLGAVLYHLLTGAVPSGKVPPPSTARADAALYDEAVMRALETNPDDRFQTVSAFREALEGAPALSRRRIRRRVALGGVSLLGIGTGIWGVWRSANQPPPFWEDIAAAQSALDRPGDHDVRLRIGEGEPITFTLRLSETPPGYRLAPPSAPSALTDPIPLERLSDSLSRGNAPGLLARLAVQTLKVTRLQQLLDTSAPTLRLANTPSAEANDEEHRRFGLACTLLDKLHGEGVLALTHTKEAPKLTTDPNRCDSFSAFCELAAASPLTLDQLEGQSDAALVRIVGYALLAPSDADPHPLLTERPSVDLTVRSPLELLAALVADRWMVERTGTAPLYDGSKKAARNAAVTQAVSGLLGVPTV